jgi:hypothetical protein
MPRLSIKTKFLAVLGLLVATFVLFIALVYPRRTERQIREQAQVSARQVAETASYALGSALANGSQ